MPKDKTGQFYYPWYPNIYRRNTYHLSFTEDAVYRRLIDEYMVTRKPLPDNDISLMRIVGFHDVTEWVKIKEKLTAYFNKQGDFLHHAFCDETLNLDSARINKSAANGAKGGRPSKGKTKEITHSVMQSKPITEQNRTEQNLSKELDRSNPNDSYAVADKSTPAEAEKGFKIESEEAGKPAADKIHFDAIAGKFAGFDYLMPAWGEAFPAIDIKREIAAAGAWLKANPANKKSNYARFLNNWLTKSQDKAPRAGGNGSAIRAAAPAEAIADRVARMAEKQKAGVL